MSESMEEVTFQTPVHNSRGAILLYHYSSGSKGLIVWAELAFSPTTVSERFHWNEIGLFGTFFSAHTHRWTRPQAFLISKPLSMIFPHWYLDHYQLCFSYLLENRVLHQKLSHDERIWGRQPASPNANWVHPPRLSSLFSLLFFS